MAGQRNWTTYRDGDWARRSSFADSPWFDGGAQSVIDKYPIGGEGTDADDSAAGDGVYVAHVLTITGRRDCGNSPPTTPAAPPRFTADGGTVATSLSTGAYRASYYVRSSNGDTSVGASETDPVEIVQSESMPRVTFPDLPTGCRYTLVLTEAGGASGAGREYCYDISAPVCDLAGDQWANTYNYGVASGGSNARPFAAAPEPPDLRDVAALIVESTGRLIFADNSLLAIRGDWVIESPPGSTDTWATFKGDGTFRLDGSKAPDPEASRYRVAWQGHGKFAWAAP